LGSRVFGLLSKVLGLFYDFFGTVIIFVFRLRFLDAIAIGCMCNSVP
jgi:hypothetical protein